MPARRNQLGRTARTYGQNGVKLFHDKHVVKPRKAGFAVSGILAELILYELRRMFRTVLANDCFVEANVKSLKRMGTYSFLIALVTAGRMFLYLTPAVMIIILVFVIAGLFSRVLSQVFDRAVAYKLENDLTI